jgi:hypothetical protein
MTLPEPRQKVTESAFAAAQSNRKQRTWLSNERLPAAYNKLLKTSKRGPWQPPSDKHLQYEYMHQLSDGKDDGFTTPELMSQTRTAAKIPGSSCSVAPGSA